MKLLVFIHSLNSGGAERVAANLASHWAEKGWHVTVVTVTSESSDFFELHTAVNRISLDLAGESANPLVGIFNNLRRVRALRAVLRKVRPNIALAMMSTANILLALAATGLKGIATVGSERTHPPQSPLGAGWETLRAHLYGRLTAMVALTQESKNWLQNHTTARRISLIPNVASWPLPDMRPHLEVPVLRAGQRLLLAVGRLSEEKQFAMLISGFQRLAETFPDWVLVILGDGPDREMLEARVKSQNLTDRVILPGRAGNIGQWYEVADLYVMSSRFEGFPNTLVEALAHGCAAISFDCETGPRDIIRDEIDGLLVPAGNIDALEGALRRVMGDEALRRRFAKRAIEARERFSLEKISGMWSVLFSEIKR